MSVSRSRVHLNAVFVVFAVLVSLVVQVPIMALADEARVGIVLSHLPPTNSKAYKALKALAGDATGEALEMTKSEMWSMPRDHLEEFRKAASAKGVSITVLDDNWNHTFVSMPSDAPMSKQQAGMMHSEMESKAAMAVTMMGLPKANVLEYALTKGMNSKNDVEAASELVLPLNDHLTVKARRTSIEKSSGSYVWHGVIDGTDDPVTLLWWPGGRLSGSITYQGRIFAVKNFGGDVHGIIELSPRGLPPEHAPMSDTQKQKMNMREDPLVNQGDASMLSQKARENLENLRDAAAAAVKPPDTQVALNTPPAAHPSKVQEMTIITMIVAYTKAAASHYSDIEKDLILLAVEEANQSFRNSGIQNVRLKLVHSYKTKYVEQGGHFDHVSHFADKGDGQMEEIHALRDTYHADVALLVVHDPIGCGLAAGVAVAADRAFAVVHHECAANSYSLAHEVGHLIGARHDAAIDNSNAPFLFGHGFVNGNKWRTMMSYEESCSKCPRLPVWSNPDITIRGEAAGSELSNNARVIREQAKRVSDFR